MRAWFFICKSASLRHCDSFPGTNMSKPEIIAVTMSDGQQALFVGKTLVFESHANTRGRTAVEFGEMLCGAMGIELVRFERDMPDFEDWEWADVHANLPDSLKESTHAQAIQLLQACRDGGMSFGDCIEIFAADKNDPYVAKAREDIGKSDDIQIDDMTIISKSEQGAWVMAWLFISDESAGVKSFSEALEAVLESAMKSISTDRELDAETLNLRFEQSDWLVELLSNYADEIDTIESQTPVNKPGPIVWVGEDDKPYEFMPSDAIAQLLVLARRAGLESAVADRADEFCREHGTKLDAMLTVFQTG